jgi:N6-L-threonylcarbamoyladenine synthase
VRGGREVLSNVIASQHELHAKFGGVVPEIASRAHIERILPVIDEALEQAGVELDAIDALAVGNRPGLIGSLLVGVASAKALAWALGRPLVGVDHVRAHLYAAALEQPIDRRMYPALGLVVSGGHTSLYAIDDPLHMTLTGRTIDDAVGEAYDKVAAILGLGFPGGPIVDRRARRGDAGAIDLPRTMLDRDSLDFSFSGLKTAVLYHVRGKPTGRGRGATFTRDAADLTEAEVDDVCASFQAAVVDVLIAKLDRALDAAGRARRPAGVVIGGGVSANSLLRRRVAELGRARGLDVHIPAMAYCLDNAAMIAGLACHRLARGESDDLGLEAIATTDLR